MQKAMNYCLGLLFALLSLHTAQAQGYKTSVENTKNTQLTIKDFSGELPIEGYSGNEIIITGPTESTPERARGLKPLYAGGTDNTGMGISVGKSGNQITIVCLIPFGRRAGDFRIKVPDNLALKITSGCERNNSVEISNMKNEVEVNICQSITIRNSTGPLVLSTISGGIDVSFSEISRDKPTSIASVSGEIDITLPAKTPVDLKMRNITGNMYSDFDLTTDGKDMKRVGGNAINAQLNGGGVSLTLTNVSGNIYLRKK
jgi:DUF4097 and DUF4098 domain-containing protein YvlB